MREFEGLKKGNTLEEERIVRGAVGKKFKVFKGEELGTAKCEETAPCVSVKRALNAWR